MRTVSALIALASLVAACGREPAAPAGQFTPVQARDLATGMTGLSSSYGSSAASLLSLAATRSATTPFAIHYTAAFPCPAGGTLTPDLNLSGGYDRQAQSAFVDLTGKETAASCAHTVDGQKMTLSGSFDLTGHAEVSGGAPAGVQRFTIKGTFDWAAADGSRGTCSLDLTAFADLAASTGTLAGSVCGTAVNLSGKLK